MPVKHFGQEYVIADAMPCNMHFILHYIKRQIMSEGIFCFTVASTGCQVGQLVVMVTIQSLHCKGVFSSLQLAITPMDDTVASSCKYTIPQLPLT